MVVFYVTFWICPLNFVVVDILGLPKRYSPIVLTPFIDMILLKASLCDLYARQLILTARTILMLSVLKKKTCHTLTLAVLEKLYNIIVVRIALQPKIT